MNDRKIITERELNYIETLYLNCNLQDFLEIIKINDYDINPDITPSAAYDLFMQHFSSYLEKHSKYLGSAQGREIWKFPNYRLCIMPYDRAKKANQFNCVIQYEQHYLFTLKKDLSDIVLPFSQDFGKYHIKRIDVTKIAKHKENYLYGYNYISPYRSKTIKQDTGKTIYLGNRKNGNVFRMYEKTKELLTDNELHPYNPIKIELFSKYFGNIENLYTYELELTRSYLKDTLGIDTLLDLPKVYLAYSNIVGGIRFYKDSDRNKRLIKNNHRDRVPCKILTDFLDYPRLEKKRYKTSFNYMIDKFVSMSDIYIEKMGLEKNDAAYLNISNAFNARRINYTHKEMVIDFKDTVYSDEMAQMTTKHKDMRDNQSNELEIEAERLFG